VGFDRSAVGCVQIARRQRAPEPPLAGARGARRGREDKGDVWVEDTWWGDREAARVAASYTRSNGAGGHRQHPAEAPRRPQRRRGAQ